MCESMIYTLYRAIALKQKCWLKEKPEYQYAMQQWESKRNGSPLDQEDGAAHREDAWGEIAFAVGLGAGIRLSHELEALGWDDEP